MPHPTAGERFCLSCRHSLRGLVEARCPECGRGFDPGNDRTTAPFAARFDPRSIATLTRIHLVFVGAATGLAFGWFSLCQDPMGLGVTVISLAPLVLWAMLFLIAVALWPGSRLGWRSRALGLLVPIALASILLTWWPMRLSVMAHRPWLNQIADQVQAGKSLSMPLQCGLLRVQAVKQEPKFNSIGLQITGGPGGGVFIVRSPGNAVRPFGAPPGLWFNTNWEMDVGDGWFVVFED